MKQYNNGKKEEKEEKNKEAHGRDVLETPLQDQILDSTISTEVGRHLMAIVYSDNYGQISGWNKHLLSPHCTSAQPCLTEDENFDPSPD